MDEIERRRVETDETLATRLADVRRRERLLGIRRREWVFLSVFLILALGAYANFKRVVVKGRSMEPTFHDGQTLIVWKYAPKNRLRPGDVIVFQQGDDELIKRVVYVADPSQGGRLPPPGFPSRIRTPNGVVGEFPYDRPWMTFRGYFFRVYMGIKPVPPPSNTIYVMGDNFRVSDDSRDFGPINPSQILGRVIP